MKKIDNNHIGGLILAGGKSRRMKFFDKSFKKIQKKTLIDLKHNTAWLNSDISWLNSYISWHNSDISRQNSDTIFLK